MSRLKWLVLAVLLAPLAGCTINVYSQDTQLRDWATRVDIWADSVAYWQDTYVFPALRSVCELEEQVYDVLHDVPGTTRRICPRGQSADPPPPPRDPENWD